jgi:hypothetical protein
MKQNWKQRAMIGVAVAAVIAGVIVAIVTTTGHSHAPVNSAGAGSGSSGRRGDLAVAASYLGLTGAQLRSDLRAGRTLASVANATSGRSSAGLIEALVSAKAATLDAAKAGGKLPKAKESARLARFRKRALAEVSRLPGAGADLSAAARYLGVTPEQILSERRSGRSLAQIANTTSGKSAAGLIDALVSARKANLAAAAAAGSLSWANEHKLLSTLRQRVTTEVNG